MKKKHYQRFSMAYMYAVVFLLFITGANRLQAANGTTVVDIIVNSPDHNTLEAAVVAAQLADDLSGEGPFTVFAPTDAAFNALPAGTVDALLQDPTGELAQILLYHVVGAKALSGGLSDGQTVATLQGKSVTVAIKDGKVYINNAQVTVADLTADNGVVHVIDAVLLPPTTTSVKNVTPANFKAVAQKDGKLSVYFATPLAQNGTLTLIDSKGRVLNRAQVSKGANTFDLLLPQGIKGVFLLKVTQGTNAETLKVMLK